MRAMVLHRTGPVHGASLCLADVPPPQPAAGEIRVRVRACGVCRTDLHVIEGDLAAVKLPLIPGHQVVGVVDAVGAGARRYELGDRVGIAWLRKTCGVCDCCAGSRENLCEASRYTGYHADGGYAEYAVVAQDYAYAIPPQLADVEAAPLLCAGIIGYRALALSEVAPGGTLGIYGFGSSAHVVAKIALHRGCKVFVATRGESHRALARALGAAWVGDATEPFPEPADGSIVFAPAGEIVPAALQSVRRGGTVALAGIYMTPIPAMEYEPCLFHEKKLTSVEANTRADGRGLLAEAAAAGVRPEVTRFALEQANEALVRLRGDGIDGSAVLLVEG